MSIPTKVEQEIKQEPYYPCSDGAPMGETLVHVEAIMRLHLALQHFFRNRTNVLIASDLFWYWEEGVPASCCAPDTMVVLGVPREDRRSFFSWLEKNPRPDAVFEMASENTWRDNLRAKKDLYERLKVPEYFIFDPLVEYLDPPLRGFRLRGKTYRPLKPAADGSLVSKELGLRLVPEGRMLRLIDVATGEKVPTNEEQVEQERQLVEQERRRAEQAEREATQRIEQAKREAARRVERAERQTERERQERQALEAELARLRDLLAKSQRPADPNQG
jgi:Uma2 family endonuclease